METSFSPTRAALSMAAFGEHQGRKEPPPCVLPVWLSQPSKRIRKQHEEEAQANTGIIKQMEELAGFWLLRND